MPENEQTEEQEDRQAIRSQRRYATVSFTGGSIVLLVTFIFPVIGELVDFVVQLTGWNCRPAQVGECTVVCREIALGSPWAAWQGAILGIGLYLASAAFHQVAVGSVGLDWLKNVTPGGGGEE